MMLWNYLRFDFGESYYRDISVIDLILEKMPVSISLGLWMTLISYGISIPARHRARPLRDGSRFDVWTSTVIIVGYAVPGFLIAIAADRAVRRRQLLVHLSRCAASPRQGFDSFPWYQQVLDYFWHMVLARRRPWRSAPSPPRRC